MKETIQSVSHKLQLLKKLLEAKNPPPGMTWEEDAKYSRQKNVLLYQIEQCEKVIRGRNYSDKEKIRTFADMMNKIFSEGIDEVVYILLDTIKNNRELKETVLSRETLLTSCKYGFDRVKLWLDHCDDDKVRLSVLTQNDCEILRKASEGENIDDSIKLLEYFSSLSRNKNLKETTQKVLFEIGLNGLAGSLFHQASEPMEFFLGFLCQDVTIDVTKKPEEIREQLINHIKNMCTGSPEEREFFINMMKRRDDFNTTLDSVAKHLPENNKKGNAANLTALTVFFSDDLVRIREGKEKTPAARLFGILKALPLEMQMVACNRIYELARELIPQKELDEALEKTGAHFGKSL